MHNKEIEKRVVKILSKNKRNSYTAKDLSLILKIKKNHYKDLVASLYNLLKKKKINLKNRHYFIGNSSINEEMSGILDGTALAKNKSYAFVRCENFDIYVSAEDIKDSFDGDEVLINVTKRKRRPYGKIIKVLKRKRESIVGTVFKYRNKIVLLPDNKKIHKEFIIRDAENLNAGEKVVLKVLYWGNAEIDALPYGKVTKVLGKSGDLDVEILATIAGFDLPLEFPRKVIAEAENVVEDNSHKRKDLRNILTLTIDPESAKDFDDAVSLYDTDNGYILYVHIADVARYVKPGSALFEEAFERGNSYYFPKKVIPMLPEVLSNKKCSLRPDEDKFTITVETHLDKNAKILSQKVYESIIRSDARLSYKEVDDLFANDENSEIDEDIQNILLKMREISNSISKSRIKNGYLSFYLPEAQYVFDETGNIADIKRAKETDSHKMIENFMLIANEFVAKKLSYSHTIYRIHEKPDPIKVDSLVELLSFYDLNFKKNNNMNKFFQNILESFPNQDYHIVFDRKILRSLKKAKYHIKNQGHFGLAIPVYTHFTSPIRRFSDLIIHHQIKTFLHKEAAIFTKKDLIKFAQQTSEKEIVADESEKEVDYKYKDIFMKHHLGETFSGTITNILSSSIVVELDKYPVSGIIPINALDDDLYEVDEKAQRLVGKNRRKIYQLADKLDVIVSKVSNGIIFDIVR